MADEKNKQDLETNDTERAELGESAKAPNNSLNKGNNDNGFSNIDYSDYTEEELEAAIERYSDYEMDDTGLDDTAQELEAAIERYSDYEIDDTGLDDTGLDDTNLEDTNLNSADLTDTQIQEEPNTVDVQEEPDLEDKQEINYNLEPESTSFDTNIAAELAAKQANFITVIAGQISASEGYDKDHYVKAATMSEVFKYTEEIEDNGVKKHKLTKTVLTKDVFEAIEAAASSLSQENKNGLLEINHSDEEITFSQAGKESIQELSRAAKGGKELLVEQTLIGKVFGDNGLVNKAIDPIAYESEAKRAVADLSKAKKEAVSDVKSNIATERVYTALVSTPIRYAGKIASSAIEAAKGQKGFVEAFKEGRQEIKEARLHEKQAFREEAIKEGNEKLQEFVNNDKLSSYTQSFLKASDNSHISELDMNNSNGAVRKSTKSAAKADLNAVKNNGVKKVSAEFISSWKDRINDIEIKIGQGPSKEEEQTVRVKPISQSFVQEQAEEQKPPSISTTYRDREAKSPANKPVNRTQSPVQATSASKTDTPNQDRLNNNRSNEELSEKDSPIQRL